MTSSILVDRTRLVTGGVDTHKDTHVGVVVDHLGRRLGTRAFRTTPDGYEALLVWMQEFGSINKIGVEGTGSYGAGLTRALHAAGIEVVEISRPDRSARRYNGKSDPIDAEAAAIAALSGRQQTVPKMSDGPVEAMRVLMRVRTSAVRDQQATLNQIRSLIDTAPNDTRTELRGLTRAALVGRISRARPSRDPASPQIVTKAALKTLGKRWSSLNTEIGQLTCLLDELVTNTAPNLVAVFGVGTHTAAALLICAGDNPERVRSEAAFAALCGVSPVPASSGKTTRHRLNRGGNRQANAALYRIVMTRLSFDDRTKAYMQRRTTEGLSKREIMRCLKRAVARELYPIIISDLNHPRGTR